LKTTTGFINRLRLISIVIFVSVGILTSRAQGIDQYLDDGVDIGKNVLKIQLLTIANGEFGFAYERQIRGNYAAQTLEFGIGLQLGDYRRDNYLSDDLAVTKLKSGGPHYYISYRWYFPSRGHAGPEGPYLTMLHRHREYDFEEVNVLFNDFCTGYGYQHYIGSGFIVDLNLMLGFRFSKYLDGEDYIDGNLNNVDLIPAAQIRFGYMF